VLAVLIAVGVLVAQHRFPLHTNPALAPQPAPAQTEGLALTDARMTFIPVQLHSFAIQLVGHAAESIRDSWVLLRQRTQFGGRLSQEIDLLYHNIN